MQTFLTALNADDAVNVSRAISDYGMMAVSAAFFLLLSAALMIACFSWFKQVINNLVVGQKKLIDELLQETKRQNDQLADISEGLRPETRLRLKVITDSFFDLAVEKVLRMIKTVREENHISDHEATHAKIHNLVENIHNDRNLKLDNFTFRGHRLSAYTDPEWVDWVVEVVKKEVYSDAPNNKRAYTNVAAIYDHIKHSLNAKLMGENML